MSYDKKYEDALERCKKEFNFNDLAYYHIKQKLEHVFPELKESEEERIRKSIIKLLQQGGYMSPENKTKAFAWLEKQGEQKPTDKIEPKFKVGDWIVYQRTESSREILQIYDIRDGRYYFNDMCHFSWSVKECDEKCHLWTIQDAKDGDVLYHKSQLSGIEYIVMSRGVNGFGNVDSYFRYNSVDGFGISVPSVFNTKEDITPATKEQRDLLFSKMKEASYEWDGKKKELKDIKEQNPTEDNCKIYDIKVDMTTYNNGYECGKQQVLKYPEDYGLCKKTAWSEEDERKITGISMILQSWDSYHVSSAGLSSLIPEYISWLKSLKERYT